MVRLPRRARSARIVKDPATAEKLIPNDHRFGEKRPPFVTGYFEVYNKPNVYARRSPGRRRSCGVTASGIETADGVREFDIVVWATGFDFGTGALTRMGIRGPGRSRARGPLGRRPEDVPRRADHGVPELLLSRWAARRGRQQPRYNGDQVDFVTDDRSSTCARHGCDTIEVDPAAEEKWTAMVDRWATKAPSFGESSYYFGTNIPGKPRKYLLNSAGRPKLLVEIAKVVETDYKAFKLSRSSELTRRRRPDSTG